MSINYTVKENERFVLGQSQADGITNLLYVFKLFRTCASVGYGPFFGSVRAFVLAHVYGTSIKVKQFRTSIKVTVTLTTNCLNFSFVFRKEILDSII